MFFAEILFKKIVSSCPESKGIHSIFQISDIIVCKHCRQTFPEIPVSNCVNHHYHLSNNVYKCCSCSLEVDILWRKPLIETQILQKCSFGLLDILLVYFKNARNGNNSPINSSNKFLSKVMDDNGSFIMSRAGYVLSEGFWTLQDLEGSDLVRVQSEVLCYVAFKNFSTLRGDVKLEEYCRRLASNVGVNVADFKGDQDFERFLVSANADSNYETLGLLPPSLYCSRSKNAEKVQMAYQQCIKEDPSNISVYLEALLEIAKLNSDLEIFALMEHSKGIPTFSELKSAYELLQESFDASDEDILSRFKMDFSNIDHRRQALKVIAASRDSLVLLHFLETGIVLQTAQKDIEMDDSTHLL